MTGFLITLMAVGTGAYLFWRHIVMPMGRVLEFYDDMVEMDGRFVTPGPGPQLLVPGPAALPDSSAREVAPARSPPPA